SNVVANSYSITAKATDSKNATTSSAPVTVNVVNNNAPTVSLTANPVNATAPATIILNATVADSDGSIAKVEFYNGGSLLSTVTTAPYRFNWNDVAGGTYSLTAKATDNLGASRISTPVTVTVAGHAVRMYDIHTDHLDTPRVITDSSGTEVWRWDSAPFGETLPNEQPTNATSKFTFNIRFAGQYFDQETGLHYNYFRDYDPRTGRYVESDPIGLAGGMTTYGYVGANPVSGIDPNGLILPVFGRALAAAAACARNPACRTAAMAASAATAKAVSDICNTAYKKFKNWYAQDNSAPNGASSPHIDPQEVGGKTPDEIEGVAGDKGLQPKGPDPKGGRGSYVDPVTGEQRILIHPGADCGPHCHVNNPQGERLDINGNVVAPESPEAHLPLGKR
ncbi:RHS repeat-associated core domain-containing protein, partial [Undibacterium sp. TJN19]|uniref:RHS repeat-associated core domain-containing protein n=1 Tax=Undibacterium sp. TJN19 TaxID=3413055 RepID=UPI003BF2111E